jgi:hypothetical protein
MPRIATTIFSTLAFMLAACASVDVSTRAEPGVDFSRYETFGPARPTGDHPVVGATIEAEIAKALAEKGYRAVAADEVADLAIAYEAVAVERQRIVNAGDADTDFYVVQDYHEGTFEIELYDARTRMRIWEGVGRIDVIYESGAQDAAAKAARAVLAKFPARP